MDRVVSVFSVYDFFGYVLAGGALLAGAYWAFSDLPDEPGAATVLGIIALGYMVGHLVQAVATIWDGWLWHRRGFPSSSGMWAAEPPSNLKGARPRRQKPYAPPMQDLINSRVQGITGRPGLPAATMFAVARA